LDCPVQLFFIIRFDYKMTTTSRNPYDVLSQIQRILYKQPEHLVSPWEQVFARFRSFEFSVVKGDYWNASPETIDYYRWQILHWAINQLIEYPTPKHNWEKQIVDVYIGSPRSDDHMKIVPIDVLEEPDSEPDSEPYSEPDSSYGQWKKFDDYYVDSYSDERETRQ